MLGYMSDSGVRYSYCAYCIDRQDFILVNGVWICETCKKPLRRATEKTEISSQNKDFYGTIVSGGNCD